MAKKEALGMTTITYKYQVTIPKKLREKHRFEIGDTIMFVEEDGKVFLKKNTDVS